MIFFHHHHQIAISQIIVFFTITLVVPAMRPSAAADLCWVSAKSSDACCGRRSKLGPEGLSSSPNQWEGVVVSPRLSTGCCGRRSIADRIDHIASPTLEAEAPLLEQELQLQELKLKLAQEKAALQADARALESIGAGA